MHVTAIEDVLTVERIRVRGRRLLVDKVGAAGIGKAHKVSEHIWAPAQHEYVRRVYGMEARVLAIGPDIDPTDIAPGDTIIMDEFGGRPIWWGDRVTPLWIVGDSEVMCAISYAPGETRGEW